MNRDSSLGRYTPSLNNHRHAASPPPHASRSGTATRVSQASTLYTGSRPADRRCMQEVSRRGKRMASDDTSPPSPEECAVCFETFSDEYVGSAKRHKQGASCETSPFKRREVFPCSHKHVFCVECSSKLNVCPLCREGRDGSSQDERIEREQQERALSGISVIAISRTRVPSHGYSGTVVLPIPDHLEHPFDSNNVRISVFHTQPVGQTDQALEAMDLPNRNEIVRTVEGAMEAMSGTSLSRRPESIIHMLLSRRR